MQLGRLYFNKENPTGCNPDKIFTDVFNSDPDLNLTPFFQSFKFTWERNFKFNRIVMMRLTTDESYIFLSKFYFLFYLKYENATNYLTNLGRHLESGRGKIVDSLEVAVNLTEKEGQSFLSFSSTSTWD